MRVVPMFEGHGWLLPILDDLIAHCEIQSLRSTAAGLQAARVALVAQCGPRSQALAEDQQERWLGEVIDELARYCHHQGLDEVEARLLRAQEAWHAEAHPPPRGNVLTFPAGFGRARDEPA